MRLHSEFLKFTSEEKKNFEFIHDRFRAESLGKDLLSTEVDNVTLGEHVCTQLDICPRMFAVWEACEGSSLRWYGVQYRVEGIYGGRALFW